MAWTATVILFWAWTLPFTEPTDSTVICTFSEDCILPCSFTPAGDEVIHWNRNDHSVHAYYRNADQLKKQHPHFKGRTSLFKDQIKNGNASLLLRNCSIQDRGKYECYTSTKQANKEKVVNVEVHASIQTVNILKIGKEVMCSSQNIYPAPKVSWTTDPPTESDLLKDQTLIIQEPSGLYSVQSKITMLGNVSDYTYACSVTSNDGMQNWRASLKQQEIYNVSGGKLIIPCHTPGNFQLSSFTLKWTVTRANESEAILTFHSRTPHISNQRWSQASVDPDQVLLGNGSLWLHNLGQSAQKETYTCEFSAFQIKHLVCTDVTFAPEQHSDDQGIRHHDVPIGVGAVFGFVVFCLLLVICRNGHSGDV